MRRAIVAIVILLFVTASNTAKAVTVAQPIAATMLEQSDFVGEVKTLSAKLVGGRVLCKVQPIKAYKGDCDPKLFEAANFDLSGRKKAGSRYLVFAKKDENGVYVAINQKEGVLYPGTARFTRAVRELRKSTHPLIQAFEDTQLIRFGKNEGTSNQRTDLFVNWFHVQLKPCGDIYVYTFADAQTAKNALEKIDYITDTQQWTYCGGSVVVYFVGANILCSLPDRATMQVIDQARAVLKKLYGEPIDPWDA